MSSTMEGENRNSCDDFEWVKIGDNQEASAVNSHIGVHSHLGAALLTLPSERRDCCPRSVAGRRVRG